MTIEDVEQAAAGFRFVGGLSMWEPKVYVARDGAIALLKMQFDIPDVTDAAGHTPLALRTGVELVADELKRDSRTPAQFVVDALARFALHEFYESILVHGARLFDPHVPAAYHPGAL